MQSLADLLRPDTIFLEQPLSSKRRVMELLSEALAQSIDTPKRDVLELLTARERLGSTGVGGGCAIPHCRIPGESRSSATIVTLTAGIDFDAPDGAPCDVFLGLAVPAETDEQHLHFLKEVAAILDDPAQVVLLRESAAPDILLSALQGPS